MLSQQIVNGIMLGSVYAMVAVALTLAPWLMGVSVHWSVALALLTGIALSNGACLWWGRSRRDVPTAARQRVRASRAS